MTYAVTIEYQSGKVEYHGGLTRAVAHAVADHAAAVYDGARVYVEREA